MNSTVTYTNTHLEWLDIYILSLTVKDTMFLSYPTVLKGQTKLIVPLYSNVQLL